MTLSMEGDARVVRTRASLRGALTALLAEGSFESLTVREIAGRAGVGYATFFRHYRDKEALLFDLNELLMSELLDLLLPSMAAHDTAATAQALCGFVREREAVCRAVLAGGAEGAVRAEAVRRAVARVSSLRPPEQLARQRPPAAELGVFHSVSATLSLLSWWLRTHADLHPDQIADAIDRLVLTPTSAWMQEAAPAA